MKICLPNFKQFGRPGSEIWIIEYEAKKRGFQTAVQRLSIYRWNVCARQCSKPARRDVACDVTATCQCVVYSSHIKIAI